MISKLIRDRKTGGRGDEQGPAHFAPPQERAVHSSSYESTAPASVPSYDNASSSNSNHEAAPVRTQNYEAPDAHAEQF